MPVSSNLHLMLQLASSSTAAAMQARARTTSASPGRCPGTAGRSRSCRAHQQSRRPVVQHQRMISLVCMYLPKARLIRVGTCCAHAAGEGAEIPTRCAGRLFPGNHTGRALAACVTTRDACRQQQLRWVVCTVSECPASCRYDVIAASHRSVAAELLQALSKGISMHRCCGCTWARPVRGLAATACPAKAVLDSRADAMAAAAAGLATRSAVGRKGVGSRTRGAPPDFGLKIWRSR